MPQRGQTFFSFFILWAIAGLCEIPFGEWVLTGSSTLLSGHGPWFLAGHFLGGALLIFFSAKLSLFSRFDPWVLFPIFIFLPLIGWLVYPFFLFQSFSAIKSQAPDEPKQEEILPVFASPVPFMPSSKKNRQERVMAGLDFIPLADVMNGNDPDLKRGAVEKMADLGTPEAVSILLAHRRDPSAEVRFYVISALARLRKEYEEEIEVAKQELLRQNYAGEPRLVLARSYLYYALSLLLDEAGREALFQEALLQLDKITADASSQLPLVLEAHRLFLSICFERQDWKSALQVAQDLAKLGSKLPPDLAVQVAEVFYRNFQFQEVRQVLKEWKAVWPKNLRALHNWWGVA